MGTRGGIYWFNMFDYYTCVVAMFFVTCLECVGLMWGSRDTWLDFAGKVTENTGRRLGTAFIISWKWVCPALLVVLTVLAFTNWDLMDATHSVSYPDGSGFLPIWSIWVGWLLALVPLMSAVVFAAGSNADVSEKHTEAATPKGGPVPVPDASGQSLERSQSWLDQARTL